MDDESDVESVPAEFDCVICLNLLVDPVTTSCGHNFCKSCLDKCAAYQRPCPTCRTPLPVGRGVNKLLAQCIRERYPKALRRREEGVAAALAKEECEATDARQAAAASGSIAGVCEVRLQHGPIYPGRVLDLRLFEASDVATVARALDGNRRIGLVDYSDHPNLGTCVEIVSNRDLDAQQGCCSIRVKALHRFATEAGVPYRPFFDELVSEPVAEPARTGRLQRSRAEAYELVESIYEALEEEKRKAGRAGAQLFEAQFEPLRPVSHETTLVDFEDISFHLAQCIQLKREESWALFESRSCVSRLRALLGVLQQGSPRARLAIGPGEPSAASLEFLEKNWLAIAFGAAVVAASVLLHRTGAAQ